MFRPRATRLSTAFERVSVAVFPHQLLAVVALTLAASCASDAPAIARAGDGRIRRTMVEAPFVEGRLADGREVPVLLDTGACLSAIDTGFARGLALDRIWRPLPQVAQMVGGTQWTWRHVRLDSLDLGGLEVRGVELTSLDLERGGQLGGGGIVLGNDVLRQCRFFFDARSHVVQVVDAPRGVDLLCLSELLPGRTWVPLAVQWRDGLPHVQVGAGSAPPEWILLDTGALQTALSDEMVRAFGFERDAVEPRADGSGQVFADGLRVGPWRARLVAQIPRSAQWARLGSDALSHMPLLWDGPGGQIWIAAPVPGAPDTFDAGFFIDAYLRGRGIEPITSTPPR